MKNCIPVDYCYSDFVVLYQCEDIPPHMWNRIILILYEHIRKEKFTLIERIHEVIEIELEGAGFSLP